MTDRATLEALRAIRAEALRMEDEDYRNVSLRDLAEQLGFADLIDDILATLVEGGWDYCLDPEVRHRNAGVDGRREYPPAFACKWGPDQLRSRIDASIGFPVYEGATAPGGS
jgi:hypothetical protein